MLNLIFGRSEETACFWEEILIKECAAYFKLSDAISYHKSKNTISELLSKRTCNFNALFYSIIYLMGIEIDLVKDQNGM